MTIDHASSFIRNLGATLGLAVAGTIINNTLRTALESSGIPTSLLGTLLNNPGEIGDALKQSSSSNLTEAEVKRIVLDAYRKGFRIIFLIMAGLAALAFVVAFILMPQVNLDRKDDKQLKEEGKKFADELKQRKEDKA